MLVEMRLTRIIIVETDEQQVIVLRELEGERAFPIIIGLHEALAIDRRIKGQQAPRPMTHDLAFSIIEAMGGHLEKIIINELQGHTCYSKLVVRRGGEVFQIDSRPSDAIAVGAGTGVPLFVDSSVLSEVC